jgi:hypothetical protein
MMEPKYTYKKTVQQVIATIPSGQQNSNLVDLGGMQVLSIDTPSNFTTCNLTFKKSNDGSNTLYTLDNFDGIGSSSLTIPNLSSGRSEPFYAHWFAAVPYLQLVSSVNQVSTVQIIINLQPIFQGIHG